MTVHRIKRKKQGLKRPAWVIPAHYTLTNLGEKHENPAD